MRVEKTLTPRFLLNLDLFLVSKCLACLLMIFVFYTAVTFILGVRDGLLIALQDALSWGQSWLVQMACNVGLKFAVDAWGPAASSAASSVVTSSVVPWTSNMLSGVASLFASPTPKALAESSSIASTVWQQLVSFR